MEQTLSVNSSLQTTIDRLVETRLQSLREELARELFTQMAASQSARSQEEHETSNSLAAASGRGDASDALQELNQWTLQIVEPTSQTEVMSIFLQASASYAGRCGLFVRKGDVFSLWRAERFPEESAGNLRSLTIPSSRSGAFKDLLETQKPVLRTRSAESIPVILQMSLGNSADEFLYLFPIVVQGKLVAALYADSGMESGSVDPLVLEILSRFAGLSLETCASRATSAATLAKSVPAQKPVEETKVEQQNERVSAPLQEVHHTHAPERASAPVAQTPVPEPEPASQSVGISELMEQYLRSSEAARKEETVSPVQEPTVAAIERTEPAPVLVASVPEAVVSVAANWTEPAPEAEAVQNTVHSSDTTQQDHPTVQANETKLRASNDSHLSPLPNLEAMSDESRDSHRKAHRFARVAVQDLLSYHKNKIDQGRAERNLYSALKEDIDKTRENYRLRFGKTTARQFDYLHYELVLKLADNNAECLGEHYPGPDETQ